MVATFVSARLPLSCCVVFDHIQTASAPGAGQSHQSHPLLSLSLRQWMSSRSRLRVADSSQQEMATLQCRERGS
jgi:hypothetical protein